MVKFLTYLANEFPSAPLRTLNNTKLPQNLLRFSKVHLRLYLHWLMCNFFSKTLFHHPEDTLTMKVWYYFQWSSKRLSQGNPPWNEARELAHHTSNPHSGWRDSALLNKQNWNWNKLKHRPHTRLQQIHWLHTLQNHLAPNLLGRSFQYCCIYYNNK